MEERADPKKPAPKLRICCYITFLMRSRYLVVLVILATFAALILLHLPLLRLPYFWDEAGYYIPAALDFYRSWVLIPKTTLPIGHTPLVIIHIGLAWRLFGYSAWVARAAMTLIAAATVTSIYILARRITSLEIAAWSALLLALSPLFFAQSTLVHLDLAAALFTTLAVLFLLSEQFRFFALAASLAVLSKETAVVLLPVVWLYAWRRGRGLAGGRQALLPIWAALVAPLVPLAAWALYYHHATGYWTGNSGYLSYNLYSTLSPVRVFWSLLRRAYELFIGGFNWLLTAGAAAGFWWERKKETRNSKLETRGLKRVAIFDFRSSIFDFRVPCPVSRIPNFLFLTAGLTAVYLLLLSLVGGAILPRYLLPVLPLFYLVVVALVMRLPRFPARLILATTAACFIWAWFINPPYPFPFEDNLAYADFVRLHEQAAHYLETQPGQPRILTAWPATDELARPFLGYVQRPLRVVPVQGFAPQEFADVPPGSFDLLYLYSRRWEPPGNLVARFPGWLRVQGRYFDYHPQVDPQDMVVHYHLRLLMEMEQRGQWVRIYSY
jgi:4-amino-4-deoxy-L-arabinose transferase-like glycosyltransferase